jgi:hypothetical protein
MLNFGGFLSSNFWTNYRCQTSASVEDLLNNKDCTVDKLLDDDDCLQEFKNFNDKLIKYFDHDKLKVLIDYITVMPSKEDGHNRGHKYPFIAGEIFNCEINQILDKFFEAPVRVKPEESQESSSNMAAPADDEEKEEGGQDDSDKEKSDTEKEETPAATEEGATEGAAKDLEAEATKEEGEAAEEKKDESANEPESQEKAQDHTDETNPQVEEAKKEEEVKTEEAPAEVKEETPAATEEKDATTEAKTEETPAAEEQKNSQEPEAEEQDKKEETPATTEKEPEEEAADKQEAAADKEDSNIDDKAMATATTLASEAAEEDEDADNKYVLLDRLFKFIAASEDEELNPVLSGYFCKLVSLLISRKQKQLVPYIFRPESSIIDHLVNHVGQKSVSEILNKLLTQIDSDFEPEILAQIQQKQQLVVTRLITQLGPGLSEENNLNGSSIIQEMFEIKEFYNIICTKENVKTIADFATAPIGESTKQSKQSALAVLNQIISHHIEKQKKKDQAKADGAKTGDEDDDDMIVQQTSDDEANDDLEASNPSSTIAQANVLVEVLQAKIPDIAVILQGDHEGEKINSAVTGVEFVPLGQQRLRTVELVLNLVKLKKESLYTALGDSAIFKNIVALVKQYPWNNFLQLKVINLFTEVIENCEDTAFRLAFFRSSGIGPALVELAKESSVTLGGGRPIRNGYMNLVVNIANKLQKKYEPGSTGEKSEDATVYDYLDSVGEEWRVFVDDELKKSNDNNAKTLGGCTTRNNQEEEDENNDSTYDVQMEKIMARFTNFNQILSQNSGNDEEDEEEEEDTNEDGGGFDEDDAATTDSASDAGVKVQPVALKEVEPLHEEFVDHTFWSLPKPEEYDVDALLAELEA